MSRLSQRDIIDVFFGPDSIPCDALQPHPVADLFPLMGDVEFAALKADIAARGVLEPIWIYEGQVLDGRHRTRACQELGIDCPQREYDGADPIALVVSLNLKRRHLNESQRAMIAARMATLTQGRPTENTAIAAITQSDASELLNVSVDSIQRAREVLNEGTPEQIAAVATGERAVSAVVQEIRRPHVANNSGENEWYTPPAFVEAARAVMGSIDTDPASTDIANRTVKASTYFDAATDGLAQTWRGNVWMNPPYAQPLIAEFCEAVVEKYEANEIVQACVLVNNATETAWFQGLLEHAAAVCFPRSRIRFLDPEGNPSGAPLQGQAVIYFGADVEAFVKSFTQFGSVLRGC